jgi:ABC-type branched-subunit amino acid transport system ATPase component
LVIDYGLPIAEGTPTEVLANQKVIEAYLGAKKAEK